MVLPTNRTVKQSTSPRLFPGKLQDKPSQASVKQLEESYLNLVCEQERNFQALAIIKENYELGLQVNCRV